MSGPSSPLVWLGELAGSEELRVLRTLRRPPAVLETSSFTTERLVSSAWTGGELVLLGKLENIRPGISSWGRAAARERLSTPSTNIVIFILLPREDNEDDHDDDDQSPDLPLSVLSQATVLLKVSSVAPVWTFYTQICVLFLISMGQSKHGLTAPQPQSSLTKDGVLMCCKIDSKHCRVDYIHSFYNLRFHSDDFYFFYFNIFLNDTKIRRSVSIISILHYFRCPGNVLLFLLGELLFCLSRGTV